MVVWSKRTGSHWECDSERRPPTTLVRSIALMNFVIPILENGEHLIFGMPGKILQDTVGYEDVQNALRPFLF